LPFISQIAHQIARHVSQFSFEPLDTSVYLLALTGSIFIPLCPLQQSAEKASGYKVLMFGSYMLQLLGLDIGLSSVALNLLLSLPNSRKVEMEADQIGLQLMSMACFDPTKAPSFW
jgi:Zn-dependent protease with chaperone function